MDTKRRSFEQGPVLGMFPGLDQPLVVALSPFERRATSRSRGIMAQLTEAYGVLSCPTKRWAYDRSLPGEMEERFRRAYGGKWVWLRMKLG